MKLHQSIAVCLALVAGSTADGCFAQSATDQNDSVAVGNAPQNAEAAVEAVTPTPAVSFGKTREQVMPEQADFQSSDQAAQMRELYRGSK